MANPFEYLLSPDNPSGSAFGGIMGAIGSAFGMPTTQERVGGIRAQAMNELAGLQASGLSPQQALVKFMQGPSGMNLMSQDPDFKGTMDAFLKSVTPPTPAPFSAAPGHDVYTAEPGKFTKQGSVPMTPAQMNPRTENEFTTIGPGQAPMSRVTGQVGKPLATTERQNIGVPQAVGPNNTMGTWVQDASAPGGYRWRPQSVTMSEKFNTMSSLMEAAQLDPTTRAQIAKLNLIPGEDPSRIDAIDQMVAAGSISQEMGQKLKAKTLDWVAIKDWEGNETGEYAIRDLSTGSATVVGGIPQKGSARPDAGGPPPNARNVGSPLVLQPDHMNPDGTVAADRVLADPKISTFLGAGTNPAIMRALSGLLEIQDPTAATPQSKLANSRANHLTKIKNALALLAAQEEGKALADIVKSWTQLLESPGFLSGSTTSNIQQGKDLVTWVNQNIRQQEDIRFDNSGFQSREAKRGSVRLLNALYRLRDTLPTMQQMEAVEAVVARGEGGVSSRDVLRRGMEAGKRSVSNLAEGIGEVSGLRKPPDDTVPLGTSGRNPGAGDVGISAAVTPKAAPTAEQNKANSELRSIATMRVDELLSFQPKTPEAKAEKLRRLKELRDRVGG